ncbi:MAG TPA: Lrp/AsnC family transcriptional regulator [bacterium]|nr:Lrp/AsnC family transcriptional regulator [bacterium]
MRLSAVEKKVLNAIQENIPIVEGHFGAMAERLGITEKKLVDTIRELREKKLIRDYSARLNHGALGFKSTLFGFKVPEEKVAEVVSAIVPFDEVTHCFQRQGEYNIWVAFIFKGNRDKVFLETITKIIGKGNILNLKTVKKFKLKTRLKV